MARPAFRVGKYCADGVAVDGLISTRYEHAEEGLNASHEYLLPAVLKRLEAISLQGEQKRLFEMGFGNGSVAGEVARRGWSVTGVEVSASGLAKAHSRFGQLRLEEGSVYDDLAARYGRFPVVISLEVVEHLYAPRVFAQRMFDLLEPGGLAILSTPYHGYWKNLALAVTGKWDQHLTALWDHGHIKFWSAATISTLLVEAGFSAPTIDRVGRIPVLAKSMVVLARRPA